MFRDWIFRNFQLSPRDNDVRVQVGLEMDAYLAELIARSAPTTRSDDLLTLVSTAEIDGEPIPVELQLGYAKLMIFAGIDTTWSAIGSGIWHLAQHADERARLVAVRRRRHAVDDGDRGDPALLRAGHDGSQGDRRHRGGRLPGARRRTDAAHVPGGEPRSGPLRRPGASSRSIGRTTATSRSASASTAASARTWPGSR